MIDQNDISLKQALAALNRGKAVIFPTDTVYGVGVSVRVPEALSTLFTLKGRDCDKPIAWLVGGVGDLDYYAQDAPAVALRLAQACWPGPLTLVVRAHARVAAAFCSATHTIGLRMPNNAQALRLLQGLGCPIATTSANRSGDPSPCSYEAIDPDIAKRVGVVLADENDTDKIGQASTVLDCTSEHPRIIRPGSLSEAYLRSLAAALW